MSTPQVDPTTPQAGPMGPGAAYDPRPGPRYGRHAAIGCAGCLSLLVGAVIWSVAAPIVLTLLWLAIQAVRSGS